MTKTVVLCLLALIWIALVGPGTFVLTFGFLAMGILCCRMLGQRDADKPVDEVDRSWALQTELRHIERDAEHETRHLSGWYRRERERIVGNR